MNKYASKKLAIFWSVFILLCTFASHCEAYDGDPAALTDEERAQIKLDPYERFVLAFRYIRSGYQHSDITPDWMDATCEKYRQQVMSDADFERAMKELADALNDARIVVHSAISKEDAAKKGMAGMKLTTRSNGETVVAETYRLMPAELAGLKAGDVITAIEGKPAQHLARDECISLIRGTPDTPVRIQFRRNGELLQTTLTRVDRKPTRELVCKLIGNIAYLRPSAVIDKEIWESTRTAISSLGSTHAAGLILDLRDGTTGGVNDGYFMGLFVPRNTRCLAWATRSETNYRTTKDEPIMPSLPMVALVNHGTYYNSEAIADCLKHNSRASLVGETTFGDANFIDIVRLDKDYNLEYPNMEIVTLSGSKLAGVGITPDIIVKETDCPPGEGPWYTNTKPGSIASPDVKNKAGQIADKQLRVGISVLQKKISGSN